MEYKVLEIDDIDLLLNFVDDENTKYNKDNLINFINDNSMYGFICKKDNMIIGFAYGVILNRPDGLKDFYMHAIDIMNEYQGNGYGTNLMKYIYKFIKSINCRKMFLITNKSNVGACKCYEAAGGISNNDDDIVYSFK